MSDAEKKVLNDTVSGIQSDVGDIKTIMDRESNWVKKHWPVILAFCTVFGCAFGAGSGWVSYNSNLVKKSDLVVLSAKIDTVSRKLDVFTAGAQKHEHAQDSVQSLVKTEADSNRKDINKIKKRLRLTTYYTEHYTEKDGVRTVTLEPHGGGNK
jgi:hypothetical protein